MTREEVKEFLKCRDSIQYFADNYVKTESPSEGLVQMKLSELQREIIQEYSVSKSLMRKDLPRQVGKSVLQAVIIAHQNIFADKEESAYIFGHSFYNGLDLLRRVELIHENLPEFLFDYNPIVKKTKTSIKFDDGKDVCAFNIKNFSWQHNGRGRRCMNISAFFDEYDFLKNVSDVLRVMRELGMMNNGKVNMLGLSTRYELRA